MAKTNIPKVLLSFTFYFLFKLIYENKNLSFDVYFFPEVTVLNYVIDVFDIKYSRVAITDAI